MTAELAAQPRPDDRTERSALDRLARRVLAVEGRAPRSLLSMRTSLVLSAVRCVVTYALVPALLPVAGWLTPLAAPVSIVLSLLAVAFAVRSLRNVWLADWSGRWAYTAFALTVIGALLALVWWDARTLLA